MQKCAVILNATELVSKPENLKTGLFSESDHNMLAQFLVFFNSLIVLVH